MTINKVIAKVLGRGINPLAFAFIIFSATSAFSQHYQPLNYSSSTTGYGTGTNRVYQVPNYGKQYQSTMKKQYRTSQAYDTLADTGMYFAAGVAKGRNTGSSMKLVNYDTTIVGNTDDNNSSTSRDTTSVDVAVGLMISSNVRFELNYLRYTGMNYGSSAVYNDGTGTVEMPVVSGGGIDADVFMFNLYYNLEEIFGNFAGGKVIPYFGVGLGFSFNDVQNYTISDTTGFPDYNDCFNDVIDPVTGQYLADGLCSYYYDGLITHAGSTTKNLAYRMEIGATWKLQNQMFFDFFFRYSFLGKVETNGTVVQDYLVEYPVVVDYGTGDYIWDEYGDYNGPTDPGSAVDLAIEDGQSTTTSFNAKERGNLTVGEVGVRFRIMF